jgi:hypothetical protein
MCFFVHSFKINLCVSVSTRVRIQALRGEKGWAPRRYNKRNGVREKETRQTNDKQQQSKQAGGEWRRREAACQSYAARQLQKDARHGAAGVTSAAYSLVQSACERRAGGERKMQRRAGSRQRTSSDHASSGTRDKGTSGQFNPIRFNQCEQERREKTEKTNRTE